MSATEPGHEEESAATPPTETATTPVAVANPQQQLQAIRLRVLPILQAAAAEYRGRTRQGYPSIVDNVDHGGVVGLNLDPGWAVYFMADGQELVGELHKTKLRTDALSMANVEKFAGRPQIERVVIDDTWEDRDYRNFISQLLHGWNYQQLRIFRVDS